MIKQKFLQSEQDLGRGQNMTTLTDATALLDQAGYAIAGFCDAPGGSYLYVLDLVQCRTGGGRAWTEHRLVRITSYDEAVAFIRARE